MKLYNDYYESLYTGGYYNDDDITLYDLFEAVEYGVIDSDEAIDYITETTKNNKKKITPGKGKIGLAGAGALAGGIAGGIAGSKLTDIPINVAWKKKKDQIEKKLREDSLSDSEERSLRKKLKIYKAICSRPSQLALGLTGTMAGFEVGTKAGCRLGCKLGNKIYGNNKSDEW